MRKLRHSEAESLGIGHHATLYGQAYSVSEAEKDRD